MSHSCQRAIMWLRIFYTLGVIFLVFVYAATAVSELFVKKALMNSSRRWWTHVPRGISLSSWVISMQPLALRRMAGTCVGPHESGLRIETSSMLLVFAKSQRLRTAGSGFQRPDLHRWTWYSNTGGARKEIDHVLVGGRWRLVQNCRLFRSAEFAGTDHTLLVTAPKVRLQSHRSALFNHVGSNVHPPRDDNVSAGVQTGTCGKSRRTWRFRRPWGNFGLTSRPESWSCQRAVYKVHLRRRRVSEQENPEYYRELKPEDKRAVIDIGHSVFVLPADESGNCVFVGPMPRRSTVEAADGCCPGCDPQ